MLKGSQVNDGFKSAYRITGSFDDAGSPFSSYPTLKLLKSKSCRELRGTLKAKGYDFANCKIGESTTQRKSDFKNLTKDIVRVARLNKLLYSITLADIKGAKQTKTIDIDGHYDADLKGTSEYSIFQSWKKALCYSVDGNRKNQCNFSDIYVMSSLNERDQLFIDGMSKLAGVKASSGRLKLAKSLEKRLKHIDNLYQCLVKNYANLCGDNSYQLPKDITSITTTEVKHLHDGPRRTQPAIRPSPSSIPMATPPPKLIER